MSQFLEHWTIVAGAAVAAGAINSVAGGGSFLSFPALLLAGVPAIPANGTNNTAMWLGTLGSLRGYRRETKAVRDVLALPIAVSAVGSVAGAILLLRTPPAIFERMIPWLLLLATVVFASSPLFTRLGPAPRKHTVAQLAAQFLVSIYGGYFGAGMGILMLAILAFSGLPNLNAMNAVKSVLGFVINGVAVIPFAIAGIIDWRIALVMAVFATAGGYLGARFFRRLPSAVTRIVVLTIAVGMTAYFFVK